MFDNRPNFDRPRHHRPWKFLLIPFGIAGMVLLLGTLVQFLWNYILPPVVGVGLLTFWQAVGLLVLCRLLFGGFRGGKRGGWKSPQGMRRAAQMRERWMNMSDEERTRFREEWRQRCRPRRREEDRRSNPDL